MNTGHEELNCRDCHIPITGTVAQEFSSNVYYWLGLRESTIGFGSEDVASDSCLECHVRPDDRHPISRFLEQRFAEVRKEFKVYQCITCHTEHQGKRVTLLPPCFCGRQRRAFGEVRFPFIFSSVPIFRLATQIGSPGCRTHTLRGSRKPVSRSSFAMRRSVLRPPCSPTSRLLKPV